MDVARVVAIGAVVLIHVIAPVVSGGGGRSLDESRWWLGNLIDASCRSAVPLFIMLSGALLLSAKSTEDVARFYVRRLQRVGMPLAVWAVLYLAYRVHVLEDELSAADVVRSLATGTPYFHLYFLFILLGLYAATPVLSAAMERLERRAVVAMALTLLSAGAIDQFSRAYLEAGEPNSVTMFVPYLGYYVAGRLLQDLPLTRNVVRASLSLFVAATSVTAVGTWALAHAYGWSARASFLYDYLSPTVIVASGAAFVLLRSLPDRVSWIQRPRVHGCIRSVAAASFGIYLVHPALLELTRQMNAYPSSSRALLVAVVLHWSALVAASTALVTVGRRTPVLRRIL
jgi:surface polysaccharide O-acyltransferase-like enzyme